jgi:hypothetical protein
MSFFLFLFWRGDQGGGGGGLKLLTRDCFTNLKHSAAITLVICIFLSHNRSSYIPEKSSNSE